MSFHPTLKDQLRRVGLPDEQAHWNDHPLRELLLAVDATYRELGHVRFDPHEPEASPRLTAREPSPETTPTHERIMRLLRVSSDWYWESDRTGRLTHLSGGFTRVTGFDEAQVLGKRPAELWPNAPDVAPSSELHQALLERRAFADLAVTVNQANGDTLELLLTGEPSYDPNGLFIGFSGVAHDVTAERRARREVERRSLQDVLTGLGNRRRFKRDADALIQRGEPFVLTLVDLDKFKAINDSEGHQAGDRVLIEVARRLRSHAALEDTVYRLSGDEFVVLSRGDPDVALARLQASLLRAIRPPNAHDRVSLVARASAGSAVFPEDASDFDGLLVAADVAMYSAKHAGGHAHLRYSRELHEAWEKRTTLGQAISQALDDDQMVLAYQPICEAATRQVVGYEALLRWPSCPLADCSIPQLIQHAEARGLAAKLTRWSVSRLLKDAPQLVGESPARFLALNLTPMQATDTLARDEVERAVEQLRRWDARLIVELTESPTLVPTDQLGAAMRAIAGFGAGIALDDFGCGTSSLERLVQFPVERLKLERFLVADVDEDRERRHVVQAVLSLARSLSMRVTAEGVERDGELATLQELGTHEVQGFLLGRPALPH